MQSWVAELKCLRYTNKLTFLPSIQSWTQSFFPNIFFLIWFLLKIYIAALINYWNISWRVFIFTEKVLKISNRYTEFNRFPDGSQSSCFCRLYYLDAKYNIKAGETSQTVQVYPAWRYASSCCLQCHKLFYQRRNTTSHGLRVLTTLRIPSRWRAPRK